MSAGPVTPRFTRNKSDSPKTVYKSETMGVITKSDMVHIVVRQRVNNISIRFFLG